MIVDYTIRHSMFDPERLAVVVRPSRGGARVVLGHDLRDRLEAERLIEAHAQGAELAGVRLVAAITDLTEREEYEEWAGSLGGDRWWGVLKRGASITVLQIQDSGRAFDVRRPSGELLGSAQTLAGAKVLSREFVKREGTVTR